MALSSGKKAKNKCAKMLLAFWQNRTLYVTLRFNL